MGPKLAEHTEVALLPEAMGRVRRIEPQGGQGDDTIRNRMITG